jgi:hypothetical protein
LSGSIGGMNNRPIPLRLDPFAARDAVVSSLVRARPAFGWLLPLAGHTGGYSFQ